MRPQSQSRIKPKKEKRWIGVGDTGRTTNAYNTKKEAVEVAYEYVIKNAQFIEIEVEV